MSYPIPFVQIERCVIAELAQTGLMVFGAIAKNTAVLLDDMVLTV
jgi:hypothetical protein